MSKKIYSGIGGQAVLNGIMMRCKDEYSLAVRLDDGSIKVEKSTYVMLKDKYKICSLPFIRGIFAMVDSLILGTKTLGRSAELATENEEIVETKFEKFLKEKFGKKGEDFLLGLITVVSFVIALSVFMLLPAGIGSVIRIFIKNRLIVSIAEGLIRILLFVLYIKLISVMPEINQTFMYHGSEHKCINCIESGLDLTVENVIKSSKEHKRCGTSFLVIVMLISIVFFMFIQVDDIGVKFLSRILLIPIVAGISYELLLFMGKFDNKFVDIISKPGMWMQGLTTKESNKEQVEVAIKAIEEVFDWKKFIRDNFS